MKSPYMPRMIHAVGLACVPVADMPPGSLLARKPVAAAVITVQERDDGHRDVLIDCMSDARDTEFPLTVLLDGALASAPTLISPDDRALLAADATARRFFAEPRLAKLAAGEHAIDPTAMFGTADERALCLRLAIGAPYVSDRDVELAWSRQAPQAAEGIALASAASRLMLWAHRASFETAAPDCFFEVLRPLAERLYEYEEQYPILTQLIRSRPMNRAGSFGAYYREYRAARDAGDDQAQWVTFEDNLLHM